MDLFESAGTDEVGIPADSPAPLAVRMRPRTLDELQGQAHLLTPGSPLRRLVEPAEVTLHSQPGTRASATSRHPGAALSSVILWGPPGTGKTTLAYLVARGSGRRFVELSAVTAGVKDVRAVVTDARRRLAAGEETVLFIDEVHRFSRSQQDALLPSVENRWVTLIAATTENPSFSVVSPLLSRSLLLTLHPLQADDIGRLVDRALDDERGLAGTVRISEGARAQIVRMAGSDARKALTVLEAAAGTVLARDTGEEPLIEVADIERAADVAAVRYDRAGDQHYDVISAFIKSMRGSDPDATMHYLARMIAAGEDPRYIARRIVIHAAEDVGLADPTVLSTAVAAQQAVAMIGMPESGLILAQAALAVATAPKSNAVTVALNESLADVRAGKASAVPVHLRDAHYAGAEGLGHGKGYRYPHDFPHAVVGQQYLPDGLEDSRYYRPTGNGFEKQLASRLEAVRRILDER